MICAHVTANILALIHKIAIMQVFLNVLGVQMNLRAHHDSCSTSLIGVARIISIGHILGLVASTALDHGQLLRIKVLFRVGRETTCADWFLIIILVVPYCV